jgi:hypothetical protein
MVLKHRKVVVATKEDADEQEETPDSEILSEEDARTEGIVTVNVVHKVCLHSPRETHDTHA